MSPIDRAEYARAIQENPAYKEALEAVKAEIYRMFSSSGPNEKDAREHYWRLHEAAAMFERVLTGYIKTGELEQMKMAEEETRAQRAVKVFKRFGNFT